MVPSPPSACRVLWSTPPSLWRDARALRLSYITFPFRLLLGLMTSLLLGCILLLLAPFLLLYRVALLMQRLGVEYSSCDILWPLTPLSRGVVWLSRHAQPAAVASVVHNQIKKPSKWLCFNYLPWEGENMVALWDERKKRLVCTEELVSHITSTAYSEELDCQVRVVRDFSCPSNEEECSSTADLLLICTRPSRIPLCTLRLISAMSDGHISFELEPRLLQPFSPMHVPQLSLAITLFGGFFRGLQFSFLAPLTLLGMSFRSVDYVWTAIENKTPSDVVTIRRGRHSLSAVDGEATNLMPPAPTITVNDGGPAFNWIVVEQLEMIQRAERLLRASTMEMMASLVAGAIRAYLREEGITHPPCVSASIPVCTHPSLCIDGAHRCKHLLLSVPLPTGVEGAIPRLWTLQRRLANVVEGVAPSALKAAKAIGSILLPQELNRRVHASFYGDCAVQFSFVRVNGERILTENSMHSLVLVPPLSAPTRLSFSFVQSASSLLMSHSLDVSLIQRPERLIQLFQREIDLLLTHLSFRLLSLTQTTFLPERMPVIRVDDDEVSGESSSVEIPFVMDGMSMEERRRAEEEIEPGDQDELHKLIEEVQMNLDVIAALPAGDDKTDVIHKLNEIEFKIENFHELLQSQGCYHESVIADAAAAKKALNELLAPYRRQQRGMDRRFSREWLRMDNAASSRRNSRSSSGPS